MRMNGSPEELGQPLFIHKGDRDAVVPELAECYKVAALNAFSKLQLEFGAVAHTIR